MFLGRLVCLYGKQISAGERELTRLFPTANVLATADLSNIGVTSARAKTLRVFSRAVADGSLSFEGTSGQVLDALTKLPGIGEWTAQYIALRALQEPDAFPASDLALRRAAASGGTPLSTRELEAMAERWRPWRGYAAMYLWHSSALSA